MTSAAPPVDSTDAGHGGAFGAFRSRDFRRLAFAVGVSLGTLVWAYLALAARAIRAADDAVAYASPATLALVLPGLVLPVITGMLADRYPRLRLLRAIQIATAAAAVLVAVWSLMDVARIEPSIAAAFLLGATASAVRPIEAAMLPRLVPRRDLLNANVVVVLPVALVTLLLTPVGILFMILDVAWAPPVLAACGSLIAYRILGGIQRERAAPRAEAGPWLPDLLTGLRTVAADRLAFGLVVLITIVAVGGGLPSGGVAGAPQGLVISSLGAVGGAVATLVLAFRGDVRRKDRALLYSVVVLAVSLLAGAAGRASAFALVGAFVASFAGLVALVVATTLLQLRVPDHLRGRTFALVTVTGALIGLPPFWLLRDVATPAPLLVAAALLLGAAALLIRRSRSSFGDGHEERTD